jgi:hypothetical protein
MPLEYKRILEAKKVEKKEALTVSMGDVRGFLKVERKEPIQACL